MQTCQTSPVRLVSRTRCVSRIPPSCCFPPRIHENLMPDQDGPPMQASFPDRRNPGAWIQGWSGLRAGFQEGSKLHVPVQGPGSVGLSAVLCHNPRQDPRTSSSPRPGNQSDSRVWVQNPSIRIPGEVHVLEQANR